MIKWIGVIIFGALMIGNASGATLTVNASGGAMYTKIQDAVDNASAGDTILVQSGTYHENVNVNKQLLLKGVDTGGGKPVTNAGGSGSAITLGADGITLDGFMAINSSSGLNGGIMVLSSNNNITNNTASNNNNGIFLYNYISMISSNNNIIGNTAKNNNYAGIYLVSSSNNRLSGNKVSNNDEGILLASSSNNILSRNNASNNNYGIYLVDSSNNMLNGSNVSYNYYGIYLYNSSNNTIYNNYFNNTNNNFLFIGTIYSNTWNTIKQTGTNILGGPYLGGNFWANPSGTGFSQTCSDADRDGICNSAYVLDANNNDYLPLSLNFTITIPSASTIGYSALVATGQNTYVQSSNGSFGLLLKGQTKTINNSVILNNTGDISAKVEARFNDSRGGVFGLVSGANVLNATNFALGLPAALVPLSNLGANVQVTVAPPGVTALDARLSVPSNQTAGDYTGTVILTFSNNI